MLAPSFNKDGIRRAEGRIADVVAKFLTKLGPYAEAQTSVDLKRASMRLMADGVMSFAYQKPYGALDAEDFESDLLVPVNDFVFLSQWVFYFPKLLKFIFRLTDSLPAWLLERCLKGVRTQQRCLQVSGMRCDCEWADLMFALDVPRPYCLPSCFFIGRRASGVGFRYHVPSKRREGSIYSTEQGPCS